MTARDSGPQPRRVEKVQGHHLSDAEIELLGRLEAGEHTFRRGTNSAPGRLEAIIATLGTLRQKGLVRFPDSRVMTREDGSFLAVGPCDLTADGREALARDRALGPRGGPSSSAGP